MNSATGAYRRRADERRGKSAGRPERGFVHEGQLPRLERLQAGIGPASPLDDAAAGSTAAAAASAALQRRPRALFEYQP
ncbi:MAG: hypothetical protein NTY19_31395 [Planctomycetota bacterium]|nr:hypothetical protein [Planctomycetota bacterium]